MKKKKSKELEKFQEQAEEIKAKVKGLGALKITLLAILTIGTVCSFVLYDYIFGSKSPFIGVDYGSDFLNALMGLVPKLIKSIQTITIILLITTIVLTVISRSVHKTMRGLTVSRLACNLIKWVVAIILVIAVLAIWGVDTTALITGAGVVTLVVGLGMQSLIADVVAGLFIVFENEFNIGDIITVDGFRGEVVEMGIRTTKLKALGNIKIFNNSDIRAVLNQSADLSTAFSYIDIEYGAAIGSVEKIIGEKLALLRVDGAKGEISYDGVNELGSSGVKLQFSVQCNEGDIFAVTRNLNKALKNMFDENGINIPFNQIVVHEAK